MTDFSELEPVTVTIPDNAQMNIVWCGNTPGYDGHCLRAYGYFGEHMPDINPNTVAGINSIEEKYPDWRQKSKTPTFLLTYNGTYIGLMDIGFTETEAKSIEAGFHQLYAESDVWVKENIDFASKNGYVVLAFGMRLRTPLLHQTDLSLPDRFIPYEAHKESRTAANALGQSYGMLNNRAGIEIREKLKASPHRQAIFSIMHIHDAQYFLVRDDITAVHWLNQVVPEAMSWQELPAIQHDKVKLGGQLAIYWPSWEHECKLPAGASEKEIRTVFRDFRQKLLDDGKITPEQYRQ